MSLSQTGIRQIEKCWSSIDFRKPPSRHEARLTGSIIGHLATFVTQSFHGFTHVSSRGIFALAFFPASLYALSCLTIFYWKILLMITFIPVPSQKAWTRNVIHLQEKK